MKFTDKEISLCKQVVKKHRKKIGEGDWYISKDSDNKAGWSPPLLNEDDYEPIKSKLVGIYDDKDRNDVPLWTISDCLELLEENGFTYTLHFITKKRGYELILFDSHHIRLHKKRPQIFEGKTRKIPCLKAVLAVLEDK